MSVRNRNLQPDDVIGTAGVRIAMPRFVPIIHPDHAGPFLRWLNERLFEFHHLSRRILGPAIAGYLFLAARAEKYASRALIVGMVTGGLENQSPEFAERSVERDPIASAAARTVQDAVRTYVVSAEYRALKEDVGEEAALRGVRAVYQRARMDDEVAEVDLELAVLRATR